MALLNRAQIRSHHTLFWLASLAVCLAAYPDVIFGNKTFLPIGYVPGPSAVFPFAADYRGRPAPEYPVLDAGAEAWFTHPMAYQERRALASGTLPFWNAHNGLGNPALSDGQTATFNPLHWIELLDPDNPLLWDLHFLLLRFLAAVFGCYLLHRLGAAPRFAVLGGPLGALHGSFLVLGMRGDLSAYALMPALLYCVVRLRQQLDAGSTAALGGALLLVLTAGHPQPAAAVLLCTALVAAGLVGWPREPGAAMFAGLCAVACAIAALLGAPYWLPFLKHVQRSWNLHPSGLALKSASPMVALQWLVPGLFSQGRFAAFLDQPLPAQSFLGIGLGILALIGLFGAVLIPATRRRAVWLVVPVLIALKVFGFPPLQWIARLPLLDRMPFTYFWFGMLYLFAVSGIAALSDLRETAFRRRVAICVGAAAVVIAGLVSIPADDLSRVFPLQVAVYTLLAVAVAALAWGSAEAWRRRAGVLCAAALAAGITAELASYRYTLSDRGNPTATPGFARWLQHRARDGNPFRVMGLGDWLLPNFSTAFGLEDVRICDALLAPEYVDFIRRYFERDLVYDWLLYASPQRGFRVPEGMLNLLNVRYLVSFPAGLEDYIGRNRVAYTDPEMQGGVVIENRRAWPRIFAVQDPRVEPSPQAVLERLGTLDASAPFAVVAGDCPSDRWRAMCASGCGTAALQQQVSDIRYGINELSFRIAVSGPSVVVVSDAMAEGWRAYVDGVEHSIFRANYLFRGLVLDAGAHSIRFEFRPPGWNAALWLAGIGLLVCAGLGVAALVAVRVVPALPAGAVGKLGD
jgi:hypothetical protein